jgi:hypothetical protein
VAVDHGVTTIGRNRGHRVPRVTSSIWRTLEAAYAGDLSLDVFERWVYETRELEAALGPERYLELISFDYRQRRASRELRKLIDRVYEALRPGELTFDYARRVAEEFLAGERDLWSTARAFTGLWYDGHEDWVPSEFVYVDSELDGFPAPSVQGFWNPDALEQLFGQQRSILAEYERAARDAATKVLDYLAKRTPSL